MSRCLPHPSAAFRETAADTFPRWGKDDPCRFAARHDDPEGPIISSFLFVQPHGAGFFQLLME